MYLQLIQFLLAAHSSIPAGRIPRTEEPGRQQRSIGSHRVHMTSVVCELAVVTVRVSTLGGEVGFADE